MKIEEFKNALINLGIKQGDNLLVSSDVTKLLIRFSNKNTYLLRDETTRTNFLDDIINCLQELVGTEGTLLFPTYNWDFCKGETFNYNKTLGQTGILSNHALNRKDFRRTLHPIYSFAVWGKEMNNLVSLNNTDSFSQDSPFDWLYKNRGKNLVIDAEAYFTFAHYVEESLNVKYRYIKNFTSKYINKDGVESTRTYSMFVRNLDMNFTFNNKKCEEIFISQGVMNINRVEGVKLGIISFINAYESIKCEIVNNNSENLMLWL